MVSVLFARKDSIYKTMPECDVWDIERDARLWPGGNSVVAHPPCRAWGRLAHMAKPRPDEKYLGIFAVDMVRKWGGVLEHPEKSRLWDACRMPKDGHYDQWGGYTILAKQCWWGHRATKPTWLYIVGCLHFPHFDILAEEGTHYVARHNGAKNSVNKDKLRLPTREREMTPPLFARWLIAVAKICDERNSVLQPNHLIGRDRP